MAIDVNVIAGDILEVVARCDAPDAQAGENVLHYTVSASAGAGLGLRYISETLRSIFAPLYAPLLANTCQFTAVFATQIFPLPRSITIRSTGAATLGTGGATPLPEQCAGLFTKLTINGGRTGRGRAYIPFPPELLNGATGRPLPAYITALTSLALALTIPQNMTVGANSVTLFPCIVNRKMPLGLAATTPVLDYFVRQGWATQRRRSYYGRTNPPA